MNFKKAYHYLFYKLYRFYESSPWKWWSDWKASLSVSFLIVILLFSISGYFLILTHIDLSRNVSIWIFISLVIIASNYMIFHSQNQWKKYNVEFNKLNRKQNRRGSFIILAITILILLNLIIMFYLMSKIDWRNIDLKY